MKKGPLSRSHLKNFIVFSHDLKYNSIVSVSTYRLWHYKVIGKKCLTLFFLQSLRPYGATRVVFLLGIVPYNIKTVFFGGARGGIYF